MGGLGISLDGGSDSRQRESLLTGHGAFYLRGSLSKKSEDEMVRWHHRLSGRESQQTLGDSG